MKIKNNILNVFILIGFLGISNVVGPIIIAYILPIIKPITKYIVALLYLFNAFFINFTIESIPIITPIPKNTSAGK